MTQMKNGDELSEGVTMGEVNSRYPGARRALFARYHIGGCSSCAYKDDETLMGVCGRNSLDFDEVKAHILDSHVVDKGMLIEPEAVKAMMDSGVEVRFVDTRTREEHEAVAIAGSYFMTQELQQDIFSNWDRSEALVIVIYDHKGQSALDTCAWFVGHEMKHSFALLGGIDRWSKDVDGSVPRYKIEI